MECHVSAGTHLVRNCYPSNSVKSETKKGKLHKFVLNIIDGKQSYQAAIKYKADLSSTPSRRPQPPTSELWMPLPPPTSAVLPANGKPARPPHQSSGCLRRMLLRSALRLLLDCLAMLAELASLASQATRPRHQGLFAWSPDKAV